MNRDAEGSVSGATFRQLLEAAPDAMIIVDREGNIGLVNSQAERLFGYTREELLGKSIETLVPERFHDVHPEHRKEYFDNPHPRPMGSGLALWGRRKSGAEFPVEISLSPVETEEGTLVTAAVRDTTERKRLLEDLRQRGEQLELESRRAQEASRLKSEFLANMSHELRTPLNAVIGFAQLMHDEKVGPVPDEQREYLGDILSSSRHLLQLINDVLDLAKVEAGKMEFSPEPIDMERVLGEARDVLRAMAASKRISVDTEVDPDLGPVLLDPAKLKQVLYNYLSNALKFTPEGGSVVLRAEVEDAEHLRLEVEDTGIGIRETDMARLFVEFQQLDASAAKKYAGTGLGLALTKRIVEAQGGRVDVMSEPGVGSTFRAILPRASPEAGVARSRRRVAPRAAGAAGALRVLVIEDDSADREWLADTLGEQGLDVETVATGGQAIAHCRVRRFDAITLDLILPDLPAADVLAAIRDEGPNAETPVVVVTVVGASEATNGLRVHDVLRKPVSPEALSAALGRVGVASDRSNRVLVIDDEAFDRRLARETLAAAGYEFLGARDGEAGLAMAESEKPAAILLDLLMPKMDGFQFLETFRRTETGSRTPVIVWTAKDLTAEERESLEGAVSGVMQKTRGRAGPLVQELHAVLARQAARRAGGGPPGTEGLSSGAEDR